jgi:nucleotide-binding universal stress UspA family protein
MERILAAIDGSDHSEKVVDGAAGLARSIGAKVVLLYVVPQLEVPKSYEQYAKGEGANPYAYPTEVGDQVLRKFGKELDAKKVDHEDVCVVGRAASKIVETASSRHAGMIVIGLHGLTGAGRMISLGGVARRVVEDSKVPVVVIP